MKRTQEDKVLHGRKIQNMQTSRINFKIPPYKEQNKIIIQRLLEQQTPEF